MNQIRKRRIDLFSLENPPDRFLLLEEVCKILAAKGLDPANLFKSLLKTCDGELTFDFGNTLIQLEHVTMLDINYGPCLKDKDFTCKNLIDVSISVSTEFSEKILTYSYRPTDLATLINFGYSKVKEPATQKQKKNKGKKERKKTKSSSVKSKPLHEAESDNKPEF